MSARPPVIVGIAGASRNAAVALWNDGAIVGMCEQERITRTRRAGLQPGRLPAETLDAMLRFSGCDDESISTFAVAERDIRLPDTSTVSRVDHHRAHAATAFQTSAFEDATILICDRHSNPQITVWRGDEAGVWREPFDWSGPAFATLYSQAAEAFGFADEGDEHRMEALARVGERRCHPGVPTIEYDGDRLVIPDHFQARIASAIPQNGCGGSVRARANAAAQIQRMLGGALLQLAAEIRKRFAGRRLCLGGGLFYNSYFTTLLAESGLFDDTFVPANPGNAGVAIGAACAVADELGAPSRRGPLSPFLGPEYSPEETKKVLDNCKLSYDFLRNGQLVERTTNALAKGRLVGWFQGRMEWGSRALGHRSILASPVAPYVLENLNVFLKQREPHRSYSVAICADDLARYFRGPAESPLMQYEYEVLDRDLLAPLLPFGATRLRVQTVDEGAGEFYDLIRAFGDLTGVPMLVNTSFNGFNEPIVCSPRDAIRVFYGTGVDMVALGSLVIEK